MAAAFAGKWTVDTEKSDSIEPMLKGMGVGWKIRKIVTMLKVVQQVEVRGDELIVSNISKHGQDSTTHVMNAGERVIVTNRGDKVIDNCTFDAGREFPLEIVAVLPSNKGSTVDRRKVIEGGKQFLQHLTYKFPKDSDKPDILMERVFVRVEDSAEALGSSSDETAKPATASAERKPSASEPLPEPQPVTAAATVAPAQKPLPAEQTAVSQRAVRADSASSGTDDACPNASPDLWIVSVFAMAFATLLFSVVKSHAMTPAQAFPALALSCVLFVGSRATARTARGAYLAMESRARWGFVVAAGLSVTFTLFVVAPNPRIGAGTRALFHLVSGLALIAARVNAGPVLPASMDEKSRWLTVVVLVLLTGACVFKLGADSPLTWVSLFFVVLVRCAAAFEARGGYDRHGRGKRVRGGSQSSRVQDKEGNTLAVSVVAFRVVDETYAQYKVSVSHEGLQWSVWRRFSQFDSLRHELRRVFGHGVLPQLPGKTWFASLDNGFLEERTAELNDFCKALFDPNGLRNQVFKIAEAKKFLGVGQGRGRKRAQGGEKVPQGPPRPTAEESTELVSCLREAESIFNKSLSVGEGDGWSFLKNFNGVQCYVKVVGELTYTKGVGMIDAPPLVVAAFMADASKRKLYDDLFKKDTQLRTMDLYEISQGLGGKRVDVADLKHVEFNSPFPALIGARDTLLVSCRIIDEDGTVTVLFASPGDHYCKPTSKYIRARVFSAGIKLSPNPAKPGSCIMSNVQCMDPNGSIPAWIVKAVAPERCAMSAKVDAALKKLPSLPEPLPIPSAPVKQPPAVA